MTEGEAMTALWKQCETCEGSGNAPDTPYHKQGTCEACDGIGYLPACTGEHEFVFPAYYDADKDFWWALDAQGIDPTCRFCGQKPSEVG